MTKAQFPYIPTRDEKPFFAALVSARANKPLRIPLPVIRPRLSLRGARNYLRTLRAAEMAAWQAF